MEEVFLRFPHLSEQIFQDLDNYSLSQCRLATRSWKNSVDEHKYCQIVPKAFKLIKKLTNCTDESLEEILDDFNVDVIDLASDVYKICHKHYVNYDKTVDETALFDAAEKGYTLVFILVMRNFVCEPEDSCDKCYRDNEYDPKADCSCNEDLKYYVNPSNEAKQTPLHYAARNGHWPICRFIIEYNVDNDNNPNDNNPADNHGLTPIHLAAKNGHLTICELFIDYVEGISFGFGDDASIPTPLHMAAANGHTSVCELLLENMRDKNPADVSFRTPLHLAAENGHLAVCELLIENVYEGLEDDYGQTPFQLAAQNGHLSVCQLFIDCSSEDKNPKGYKGQTPLHFAAKHGQLEVCQLILKHVSDKNPKNYAGKTPLQLAVDSGRTSVTELFKSALGIRHSKRIRLG